MAEKTTALKSRLAWALVAGVLIGLIGLLGIDGRTSVSAQGQSTDATLSALTLSGVDFGTFASGTTTYTATVESTVTETTVRPRVNHSGASYVIKLAGVADDDGAISLGAGDNVITVEVTAEDGQTTQTYTVTVTRTASDDASLSYRGILLSGIDLGNGMGGGVWWTPTEANVYNSVSETTVTATPNHAYATYVVKLGGVEDADRTISLAVGSNVITVEVTAEDGQTTRTYTATVNRAAADDSTTGLLSTDDPPMNLRVIQLDEDDVSVGFSFPRNRGITAYEVQRYEHDGAEFVSSGSADRVVGTGSGLRRGVDDYGGSVTNFGTSWDSVPTKGALYKYVVTLKNSDSSTVIEESIELRVPSFPGPGRAGSDTTEAAQADAALTALALSGMKYELDFNGVHPWIFTEFQPEQHAYVGNAPNSLSQLTITPTLSQSDASYVIKKGGVTDADGTVPLDVGTNFITIEVTAPDDTHYRTYYLTITRVEAGLPTDATLSGLTLSGIDFGTFASATTSYSVTVADTVSETTVTPTVNDSDAYFVVRKDNYPSNIDATPTVRLTEGNNVISVDVTAGDYATTKTYTVTVARGQPLVVQGIANQNTTEESDTFSLPYSARRGVHYEDNVAVTWSLTGDDSDDFTITNNDAGYGILNFASTPDYENPTDSDTNNVYNVTVNASDGTHSATHDVRVTVTDVNENNSPATGAPTITGTAQVGQTLTADTSGIDDPDGLTNVSYQYRWWVGNVSSGDVTGSTYTVRARDNGEVITVRVSFTDDAGNPESLTSEATAAVVTGGV